MTPQETPQEKLERWCEVNTLGITAPIREAIRAVLERLKQTEAEVERLRQQIENYGTLNRMAHERLEAAEQHHADYHAYCSARQTTCPHEAEVLRRRALAEATQLECNRLAAEVERLTALLAVGPWDAWRNAEAEVARLRGLLDRYAQHTHGCNALHGGKCDPVCGRDVALREDEDEASGTPPDPAWEGEKP